MGEASFVAAGSLLGGEAMPRLGSGLLTPELEGAELLDPELLVEESSNVTAPLPALPNTTEPSLDPADEITGELSRS